MAPGNQIDRGLPPSIQPTEKILILDFGSQYTQLIARRVRELEVFSEIVPFSMSASELAAKKPYGIILSGGPASVYAEGAPLCDPALFSLSVPILGICYGMQLMAHLLGGSVEKSSRREYGRTHLTIKENADLFAGLAREIPVWMSHGDKIDRLPDEFESIAVTDHSPAAVIRHRKRPFYGLQFHPEVSHTPDGTHLLENFIRSICGCKPTWNMGLYLKEAQQRIKEEIGHRSAIAAISGGVDSTVAAVLVQQAIGDRLRCVFVDNGLLRKNEAQEVSETLSRLHLNLKLINAEEQFLTKLSSVKDFEERRKIIGQEFISLFEQEARADHEIAYLVQGTLYPDLIESGLKNGLSAKIKTHHNVGGLPEKMNLSLVEPLRFLFKDEVRKLGAALQIPASILNRHPFPGPGLAVRILGDVTKEKLNRLREADAIVEEEIRAANLYQAIWQAFAVDLSVQSVGVMGDKRTEESVIAVRAVTSIDGMTADWAKIPHDVLASISTRITNEVHGVNRVVYDISSKPPSTIEWG